MSLNRVELIGFVGGDPQYREFDNGGAVLNASLATTEKGFTAKDGRKIEEKTEWHNIVFRNQSAKYLSQVLHKGDKIFVEGKLTTRKYEQQGQTKSITEIICKRFELMKADKTAEQDNAYSVLDDLEPF